MHAGTPLWVKSAYPTALNGMDSSSSCKARRLPVVAAFGNAAEALSNVDRAGRLKIQCIV